MSKIRVATVEYLNSLPFRYGIEESGLVDATLQLATPSECASLLQDGSVDVALIPVGSIARINESLPTSSELKIVTSHCIGAVGAVRTVVLMSDDQLCDIKRIWLDSDSETSVQLLAYLCANHYGISPEWHILSNYDKVRHAEDGDAFMLIGDKVFEHEGEFEYTIDLAEEWISREGLPFTFAVWCVLGDSALSSDDATLSLLDDALTWGVEHTFEALRALRPDVEIEDGYRYLTENIDTLLDNAKQASMSRFLGSRAKISLMNEHEEGKG